MRDALSSDEVVRLVRRVFAPRPTDRGLGILVDLPDRAVPDNPSWRARRAMARSWSSILDGRRAELGFAEVLLVAYRNVRANNAELPETVSVLGASEALPDSADDLASRGSARTEEIFERCTVAIAPTELSATAPLKLVGKRRGLRAVTMPGFTEAMVPALRLDYELVDRRTKRLKELLDPALAARIAFVVDGRDRHELYVDLRNRTAHASSGLQTEPGSVGNLPSGETYIVPYEGEHDPSRTAGTLPVQLGEDVVVYEVRANVASKVLTSSPRSDEERRHLEAEPAYGNLAELGLGILGELGVEPCGELLLDEKLGLHIAFGRSDHFGGQVGPERFSSKEAVVHIDRVYVPRMQPRVAAKEVVLESAHGSECLLMSEGRYVVDLP
jgi:hypothetical protein